MAEGMKRAVLAALLTRAPWGVTTWNGGKRERVDLTAADVAAMYTAVVNANLASCGYTGRRADRALQLLRTSHLIEYVDRTWRAT